MVILASQPLVRGLTRKGNCGIFHTDSIAWCISTNVPPAIVYLFATNVSPEHLLLVSVVAERSSEFQT